MQEALAAEYLRDYDLLASNIASNICCKAKLDNSRIGFYEVREHKVACNEESGTPLTCSFG